MNIDPSIQNSVIARRLGISPQAITKWTEVPAERVLSVAAATEWRVTPHMLRPDLYPHEDDGIPIALRARGSRRASRPHQPE